VCDSDAPSAGPTPATPFDQQTYRLAFERYRRMPPAVFDRYYTLLGADASGGGTLLDVGAGPGLLAEALLQALPESWNVVAVEPSAELAGAARSRLARFGSRATVTQRRFADLSNAERFGAAWLSEVAHLLGDPRIWAGRLASHVLPGGRVLVRTSTHRQLVGRQWYEYFPTARAVDLARHPTRSAVVDALAGAGFADVEATTVNESRIVEPAVMIEMFRRRAFSTLHHVDDAELRAGIEAAAVRTRGLDTITYDYEMTAYTARRAGVP
jgi:2-polyprenyl-3-methyl-5-hydroxy-6-metoxy-1,4-benzoquinol methylase